MAAEFETQKALFNALDGIGLRVYDAAPQAADGASTAVFPYVEVGAIVMGEFDTNTETGFDFVARIHTRSRSASMKECKDIQGQIYDRLHRGVITVTGYNAITLQREQSFCERVADNSFHGICEYRGLIEYAG
jgi:hypothetical protein